MRILSHNLFLPQATWEGSADPEPLCFWDVCCVPGGAPVGSVQLAHCETRAGVRCLN